MTILKSVKGFNFDEYSKKKIHILDESTNFIRYGVTGADGVYLTEINDLITELIKIRDKSTDTKKIYVDQLELWFASIRLETDTEFKNRMKILKNIKEKEDKDKLKITKNKLKKIKEEVSTLGYKLVKSK